MVIVVMKQRADKAKTFKKDSYTSQPVKRQQTWTYKRPVFVESNLPFCLSAQESLISRSAH